MPRLGELLVAAGTLTQAQVDQALRAQVMWGARLGTNLIELGCLNLDQLSTALGEQHKLPAALARHFERVDPALQARLPVAIAEALACLPLFRVGPAHSIVVASSSPLSPASLARIAEALDVTPGHIVPAVAAELRIRYQLERVYRIARSARFMRSPGKTIPPFPALVIEATGSDSDPELVLVTDPPAAAPAPAPPGPLSGGFAIPVIPTDHDDVEIVAEASGGFALPDEPHPEEVVEVPPPPGLAPRPAPHGETDVEIEISIDPEPAPAHAGSLDELAPDSAAPDAPLEDTLSGRERRTYLSTIADAERPALGRIAIRRVAIAAAPAADAPTGPGATLPAATRAIRRAAGRDTVAELSLDALSRFVPACEAAIVLVLRGQVATSWLGFNRAGTAQPEIAVPLDQPGLVPRAATTHHSVRADADDLPPLDQRVLAALGPRAGFAGALAVVPILVGGQVLCVLALALEAGAPLEAAEAIAGAAGAAFARLMRAASR